MAILAQKLRSAVLQAAFEGKLTKCNPEEWAIFKYRDVIYLENGIKVSDVQLPYLEAKYLRGSKDPEFKSSGRFIAKESHVILVDGENSGEVFSIPEEGIMGSTFKKLEISDKLTWEYAILHITMNKVYLRENKRGAAIPHLNKALFNDLEIPVPPLEEQQRIVAKIEELLAKIDEFEVIERELEVLKKAFPGEMKEALLQAAMQGKLVEQRPEEGTAEELYKQIQAEKQRLIKAGTIKKGKPLPEITEDEKPFDIPESWKWTRFCDVIDVRDGTHDTPKYVPVGIPLVTSKNLASGTIDFETTKLISFEDAETINKRSTVHDGDILFAMIGTIGNPVLVKKDREFCIKNMALFKPINQNMINMEYFLMFLQNEQYVMKKKASGGVQVFVSLKYLRNYLVPLPPLAEQKRIVAKLEEILPLCDELAELE